MQYTELREELRAGKLSEAFPHISEKASAIGNWELSQEIDNMWMTYKQMLTFMLNGINDPHALKLRNDIANKLSLCTYRLERHERLKMHGEEKYVSTQKSLANIPSLENIATNLENICLEIANVNADNLIRPSIKEHTLSNLNSQHEAYLLNLFNWTWTCDQWQNIDADQANRIMFSDSINENDKCVFVSAVTLSLLEFFDIKKMLFLLDCYLLPESQVAERAIVGIALIMYMHHDEKKNDESICQRMLIYRDDPTFVHELYSASMQLQLSCTTDKVSQKMRNDILPTLMMGHMMKQNDKSDIKDKIQETLNELTKNGENPEWIDIDSNKVDKKVQEMANLQLDGSDVYYGTFAMMKGYSFFTPMPHWFYPFDMSSPLVPEVNQLLNSNIGRIIKLMLNGAPFCNSDKYSLCFTLNMMTGSQDIIEQQIMSQLPDGESINDLIDAADNKDVQKIDIRRQYIFDLYRFYYSFPYHLQFVNPFAKMKEQPISPICNSLFQSISANKEELAQYADFLMRKEFYRAALDIFLKINPDEFDNANASMWQKIGFCHHKLGNSKEAIHAYHTANTLKPNSKWTLSHLASLVYSMDLYEDAIIYYNNLLEIEPENKKYLSNISKALMQAGRHTEAIQALFKLSYIGKATNKDIATLAWCLVLDGKNDKAMVQLQEIKGDDSFKSEANILLAMMMLTDGNIRQAYEILHSEIADDKDVATSISEMLTMLANHGRIDSNFVPLFCDALILNIE